MEPSKDDTRIGNPELVERIRREIERIGPITFERFMTMALYETGLGYYAAQGDGARLSIVDFQTSPQVHPAFGDLIAAELLRIWNHLGRPNPLIVAEPGAGDGTLARHIITGISERCPDLAVRYHAADVRLGASIQSGVAGSDVSTWKSLELLANSNERAHCVISNEFLDALPVHRVHQVAGTVREVYVEWRDRGFSEQLGAASDAALEAWDVAEWPDPAEGWSGEVCSAVNPVVRAIAGLVERGVVLTIDYGYGDNLHGQVRPGESLVAYHRQQWTADLYRRIGEQDLTSHVDFRLFLRLGRRYGLEPAGSVSQRDFLLGSGLARFAEKWAHREPSPGKQWQARFAMTNLVRADGL
ncbi:MAG TPA: SAM-dependent methyltransferase, partial [Chloroflexota bacterium]|nr:SAM-dependent methyltransferase [Chloroflexota bacterium]